MPGITITEALEDIDALTNPTVQQIKDVFSTVNASVENGKTAIFNSGEGTYDIVQALKANDNSLASIGDTEIGGLRTIFADDDAPYKQILQDAIARDNLANGTNYTFDEIMSGRDADGNRIPGINNSIDDLASSKYATEAKGNVKIISVNPDPNSVFIQSEMDNLLNNTAVNGINDIDKSAINAGDSLRNIKESAAVEILKLDDTGSGKSGAQFLADEGHSHLINNLGENKLFSLSHLDTLGKIGTVIAAAYLVFDVGEALAAGDTDEAVNLLANFVIEHIEEEISFAVAAGGFTLLLAALPVTAPIAVGAALTFVAGLAGSILLPDLIDALDIAVLLDIAEDDPRDITFTLNGQEEAVTVNDIILDGQHMYGDSGWSDVPDSTPNLIQGVGTITGTDEDDLVLGGINDETLNGGDGDDTIIGDEGNDMLSGGDGYNTLDGSAGEDTVDYRYTNGVFNDSVILNLAAGTAEIDDEGTNYFDTLYNIEHAITGNANDTVTGTDQNNLLVTNGGNDSVVALDGDDTILGGDGNDTIDGGDGNDDITGGTGNDSLIGGTGNDTFNGVEADDTVDGGSGIDVIVFPFSTDNEFVDMNDLGGFVVNVEGVITGAGDDVILDGAISNVITTLDGDDFISAKGGNDTITMGAGNDTLSYSLLDGSDSVIGASGYVGDLEGFYIDISSGQSAYIGYDDVEDDYIFIEKDQFSGVTAVVGTHGSDSIRGSSGADSIDGSYGDDFIDAGKGIDVIEAGDGDDEIIVGDARTTISGGSGIDLLSYANVSNFEQTGIRVTFLNATSATVLYNPHPSEEPSGSFTGIEGLSTTVYDDIVIGSADTNFIDVLTGADSVDGGAGDDFIQADSNGGTVSEGDDDTLIGGADNDNISGGSGDDLIYGDDEANNDTGADSLDGGDGNDTIYGGKGNDIIYGETGDDSIDGGEGDDIIYGNDGSDTILAYTGNDTVYGGTGNNSISGESGDDLIFGGSDSETLLGGTGSDTILGYDGKDVLSGGSGQDYLDAGNGDNTIFGGNGVDSITAGTGADSISGDGGSDSIESGGGDDTILGGAGNDTIDAGNGDDSISAGSGSDSIIGATGNDTIDGGDGDDTIEGGAGDDYLSGGADNDSIFGGNGSDTLLGGIGNDSLFAHGGDIMAGGNGADYYDIVGIDNIITDFSFGSGDIIELGTLFDQMVITDTDYGVHIGGTSASVTVYGYTSIQVRAAWFGQSNPNDFLGSDAADTLTGTAGNDFLEGYDGDDSIVGGAGNDTIFGDSGTGNDTLLGGTGDDLIFGHAGDDSILGEEGNDTLEGGLGDDTIYGGSGDDLISGGSGIDVVDGGSGNDTLDFSDHANGVYVNLLHGKVNDTTWEGSFYDYNETFTNIENITGSDFKDYLHGGQLNYTNGYTGGIINALGGDDHIKSWNGSDTIYGGDGNDFIENTSGNDIIYGEAGNDSVYSYTGNVKIYGGAGNDSLNVRGGNGEAHGGDDNDNVFGHNGNDTLFGDAGNDTIRGYTGDDELHGGDGDDYLYAENGSDVIYGDAGNDTILLDMGEDIYSGGADADRFVFQWGAVHNQSHSAQGMNTITDFNSAEMDVLDISVVLEGYTAGVDDIHDFITITDDGTDSFVTIDVDGAATGYSAVQAAILSGVTGLNVTTMETEGTLFAG